MEGNIVAILHSDMFIESTDDPSQLLGILVDKTNFYAEKGGQVADTGYICNDQVGIGKVVVLTRF